MPSPITTHVLDLRTGRPSSGVRVTLERKQSDGTWQQIADGVTNGDGRVTDLLPAGSLEAAVHRITFATGGLAGFYPEVTVTFDIDDASEHYHVPLLLSPFGYSTYRGS